MKISDIKLTFSILDKVYIKDLKRDGYVEEIRIMESGIKYLVRYIDNADVKINLFIKNELQMGKNNEKIK